MSLHVYMYMKWWLLLSFFIGHHEASMRRKSHEIIMFGRVWTVRTMVPVNVPFYQATLSCNEKTTIGFTHLASCTYAGIGE